VTQAINWKILTLAGATFILSGFPAQASEGTVLANQQKILSNQESIKANQRKILNNQDKILNVANTILNNQKKLDTIIANQEECKKRNKH
jgi:cytochrome c556